MKNFIQQKLKDQKGMTLIELLAVIVIIAIIAAIAIPAIGGIIENSRVGAIKSDAINIINAAKIYEADSNADSVTLKMLQDQGYIKDAGSFQDLSDADKLQVTVNLKDGALLSGVNDTAANAPLVVGFDNAGISLINSLPNGAQAADPAITETRKVGTNASATTQVRMLQR